MAPVVLSCAVARVLVGLRASALPPLLLGDLSQWVDTGDRMLAGERPYRDFTALYGPLLFSFSSSWYRWAGANLYAAQSFLEVVSPLCCWLLAWVVASLALKTRHSQVLFAAAVALIGLDHFYWSPALRVWAPLACLTLAERGLRAGDLRAFAAASALCGVCPFVSIEAGVAAGAGCAALALTAALQTRRPAPALAAAAYAAPVALWWMADARTCSRYFAAMRSLAGTTNWYGGVPFPGLTSLRGAVMAGAFLFVAVAGVGLSWRVFRDGEAAEDRGDLAFAIFSAVLLRSTLGRSDHPHFIFALPAVVLLWLRVWERLPGRAAFRLVLAAAGLLSLVACSAVDSIGNLRQVLRLLLVRPGTDLAVWPGEGLQGFRTEVERAERIVSRIQGYVGVGERVLSLPLPIYAHLARRRNALPMNYPEHLLVGEDAPARGLRGLAESRPPLVVFDTQLLLPLNLPPSAEPMDERLSWATPADEPITRGLRAYLRSNYSLIAAEDGVFYFAARREPLPPRPENVRDLLHEPLASRSWSRRRFGVDGGQVDELRLGLHCSYLPGFAALAKTYAAIGVVYQDGVREVSIRPVPPERLKLDLRVLVKRKPIQEVFLDIVNPGPFNPAPRAVRLDFLRLVRFEP